MKVTLLSGVQYANLTSTSHSRQ